MSINNPGFLVGRSLEINLISERIVENISKKSIHDREILEK